MAANVAMHQGVAEHVGDPATGTTPLVVERFFRQHGNENKRCLPFSFQGTNLRLVVEVGLLACSISRDTGRLDAPI